MLSGGALAKAPKLNTQTPYWHRFVVGDAEVTVVSDGPLPLGDPSGTFTGVPKEEVKKMLVDNFMNPDNVVLEQNSPVVNIGDKLVLFDTGMGTSKMFGPTTGQQQKNLAASGIKAADIDAVVCTHAHIDHIGGLVGADDKPLFPNAQVYIAQADYDFWIDEGKLGSPLKDFVLHARKNLLPVKDRLVFIKDGKITLSAPMEVVGERFTEVLVGPEQREQALAFKPLSERQVFGKSVFLFDGPTRGELAALGEIHKPSVADIFVATMKNGATA